jgi:hypothetical protein
VPKKFPLVALIAFATLTTSAWAKGRTSELLVGKHVQIAAGETRDQDLVCIGCTVSVEGSLDGDIVLLGGHLAVTGNVTGDLAAFATHVMLGDHSRMDGDVAVIGGKLMRDPGSVVAGDVAAPRASPLGIGMGLLLTAGLAFFIPLAFISLLLVLVAFAIMGQKRVAATAVAIQQHSILAVLVGGVLCGAFFSIGHSFRFLGPLVTPRFVIALLLCAALIAGYAGLSFALGSRISRRASALGMTMVGALVIAAIQVVPIVGWAVFVFCACLAIGGTVLSGFGSGPDWFQQRGRRVPPAGATAG